MKDGVKYDDFSAANEQGNERFRPFGWSPQPGNALYLGFKPRDGELDDEGRRLKAPEFPERLVLRVFLPPPAPTARSKVSRGEPPRKAAQTLVWEYRSELDLAPSQKPETLDRWRPLATRADETLALTREGNIELSGPGPDILAAAGGKPTPDEKPRYWLRCRLAEGFFPRDGAPEIAFLRANVVEVESLATFTDEVLGESDGFRQEFTLRHTPVDPPTLVLEVEGPGEVSEAWTRKDDFLDSGPDDAHFLLNPTNGTVRFGDGRNGRLPSPGGLVIAREYRAGGGAAGNVRADTITTPPAGTADVDRVTNPRPAAGGKDEESLRQLKDRAPLALRGDSRAVTEDDYRRFAEDVPGVAKANALPLRHPDRPGFPIAGTVTVVVAPDEVPVAPDGSTRRPVPTQELLDRVARELSQLRTVGTELFVTGPDFKDVAVLARVVPADGAADSQVKEGVKRAIEDYLAPVRRPERKEDVPASALAPRAPKPVKKPEHPYPHGWPFGEPFYPSRLFEVILSATDETGRVKLARSVSLLQVAIGGRALGPGKIGSAVPFEKNELPFCTAQVELP